MSSRADAHAACRTSGGVVVGVGRPGETKNGSWASAIVSRTPICCQRRSYPSGRTRWPSHGLPAQPRLDRRHVRHGYDPAHPATALVSPGTHGTAEGGVEGGGVVERGDDLEVRPADQRQDEVARAEARVQTPVGEGRTEGRPDPLDRVGEVLDRGCVRDMVEAHGPIEHRADPAMAGPPVRDHQALDNPLPGWDKHTLWGTSPSAGSPTGRPAGRRAGRCVDRVGGSHVTLAGEESMGNAKLVHESGEFELAELEATDGESAGTPGYY